MNLLELPRSFFRKPTQATPITILMGRPIYDLDTYIALHLKEAEESSQKFKLPPL